MEWGEERAPYIVQNELFLLQGKVHETFMLVGFLQGCAMRDLCWLGH